MSGGSWNYLCYAWHTSKLSERRSDILAMADCLEKNGHVIAGEATRQVAAQLSHAEQTAKSLESVWRAVEWHDSNDYGPEQVTEAVSNWEKKNPERTDALRLRLQKRRLYQESE